MSPQTIITLPLLEGLDGIKKMSKSENNYIGITEDADQIFGKTMSIPDQIMFKWFDLLSLQSALEKIDLIENFSVIELSKNEVKMKIKYYGKIKSITEKFSKFGIKVLMSENQWKLKII